MSGPGNREVRPEVIYDWKTVVEMICEKNVFRVWSEREKGVIDDGDGGDADENGDLAKTGMTKVVRL